MTALNHDWETRVIREAIIETGDTEALRLFDEEQEELKKKAEVEIEEMLKSGEYAR